MGAVPNELQRESSWLSHSSLGKSASSRQLSRLLALSSEHLLLLLWRLEHRRDSESKLRRLWGPILRLLGAWLAWPSKPWIEIILPVY
jgi:hypothetical protein